jgi:hypothetical protein
MTFPFQSASVKSVATTPLSIPPLRPIITFFFNFFAKFKISIEDLGLEKSMITSVFSNAFALFF